MISVHIPALKRLDKCANLSILCFCLCKQEGQAILHLSVLPRTLRLPRAARLMQHDPRFRDKAHSNTIYLHFLRPLKSSVGAPIRILRGGLPISGSATFLKSAEREQARQSFRDKSSSNVNCPRR